MFRLKTVYIVVRYSQLGYLQDNTPRKDIIFASLTRYVEVEGNYSIYQIGKRGVFNPIPRRSEEFMDREERGHH